jgi:hypothetical protein
MKYEWKSGKLEHFWLPLIRGQNQDSPVLRFSGELGVNKDNADNDILSQITVFVNGYRVFKRDQEISLPVDNKSLIQDSEL